jgi:hypothetical protein
MTMQLGEKAEITMPGKHGANAAVNNFECRDNTVPVRLWRWRLSCLGNKAGRNAWWVTDWFV